MSGPIIKNLSALLINNNLGHCALLLSLKIINSKRITLELNSIKLMMNPLLIIIIIYKKNNNNNKFKTFRLKLHINIIQIINTRTTILDNVNRIHKNNLKENKKIQILYKMNKIKKLFHIDIYILKKCMVKLRLRINYQNLRIKVNNNKLRKIFNKIRVIIQLIKLNYI